MNIRRFSAIDVFGVPVDTPEQILETKNLQRHLAEYAVIGTEITPELADITPYYWQDPAFRFYLSRKGAKGPAVLDLMPRYHESVAYKSAPISADSVAAVPTDERTIEIPTDQCAFVIIGNSPRFAGKLCIHEVVMVVEEAAS